VSVALTNSASVCQSAETSGRAGSGRAVIVVTHVALVAVSTGVTSRACLAPVTCEVRSTGVTFAGGSIAGTANSAAGGADLRAILNDNRHTRNVGDGAVGLLDAHTVSSGRAEGVHGSAGSDIITTSTRGSVDNEGDHRSSQESGQRREIQCAVTKEVRSAETGRGYDNHGRTRI
jgi:hypothetical protein